MLPRRCGWRCRQAKRSLPPMARLSCVRSAARWYIAWNQGHIRLWYGRDDPCYGIERATAIPRTSLGHLPHVQQVPEVLIDTGAPGSIDETFAHKPSVITHDGLLYHFYCAVSGKWPNEVRGIAVARSMPW